MYLPSSLSSTKILSKLLLLSCSQRKRLDSCELPAIDRYDGPSFRLLRRYLRQNSSKPVEVKILSAEYGLISADASLPYYDRRMTKERSKILHRQVIDRLESSLNEGFHENLLICLGKDYFEAIHGYERILPQGMNVQLAPGGLGRKLSIMHDWLYDGSSTLQSDVASAPLGGSAYIRGIEVTRTPEEILDVARKAIAEGEPRATKCQSWYVRVDEQRVSPKWLASSITGLPVKKFATNDARRILTKLGIDVERV